jgi:general secretion pathway protein M
MKEWWQGLNAREQVLLVAVMLVALFVLIDSVLLESFRISNQQLTEQVEQAREDLQWMQGAVFRLTPAKSSGAASINGRIVSYIDQQIQRHGLKDKMLQMSPIQDHSVRIRLQDVPFPQLLKFLAQIDGAVLIEEARILPADSEGLVNASLVLVNPQAAP